MGLAISLVRCTYAVGVAHRLPVGPDDSTSSHRGMTATRLDLRDNRHRFCLLVNAFVGGMVVTGNEPDRDPELDLSDHLGVMQLRTGALLDLHGRKPLITGGACPRRSDQVSMPA